MRQSAEEAVYKGGVGGRKIYCCNRSDEGQGGINFVKRTVARAFWWGKVLLLMEDTCMGGIWLERINEMVDGEEVRMGILHVLGWNLWGTYV
ncbi:hypothetical protein ACLOJK_036122 [Asimina triloba]